MLKGSPLAQRVYGDSHGAAAYSTPTSTFPPTERVAASKALAAIGWRCTSRLCARGGAIRAPVGSHIFVLEVHSSALDDPLLDHIQFPVEHQLTRVGRFDLPAHSGRFVPAYLATHLAKHHEKPLLWAVDFFSLVGSCSPNRIDAMRSPRRARPVWTASRVGDRSFRAHRRMRSGSRARRACDASSREQPRRRAETLGG